MPSDFSQLVRQRRTKLGLSQARLAELVGRSPSTVRAWERGSSLPTDAELISALAAILGIEEPALRESVGLGGGPEQGSPVGEGLLFLFDEEDDRAAWNALSAQVTAEADEGGRPAIPPRDEGSEGPGRGSMDVPRPDLVRPRDLPPPAPERVRTAELPFGAEPAARAESTAPVDAPPPLAPPTGIPAPPAGPAPVVEEGPTGSPTAETLRRSEEAASRDEPPRPSVSVAPVQEEAAPTRTASPTPRAVPAEPTGEPSYLEDPKQMAAYWVRTAFTVAISLLLLVVLVWAMGRLGDSLDAIWELFKSSP